MGERWVSSRSRKPERCQEPIQAAHDKLENRRWNRFLTPIGRRDIAAKTRSDSSKNCPPTADERPAAQKADCLWLLFFNPDQVHRAPSQGPLIGGRTSDESSSAARIGQIGQLGREP